MSRSRLASHVYVAAGDLRDAAERLAWSWDQERRDKWVSDRHHAAERIEALQAERQHLIATVPPDVSPQLTRVRKEQAALERDLSDLRAGAGRWSNTAVGDAYHQLLATKSAHRHAERCAEAPGLLGRRQAGLEVEASRARVEESERALRRESEPHTRDLDEQLARLADEVRQLEARQQARVAFIDAHPEVIERVVQLGRAVEVERAAERRNRTAAAGPPRHHAPRSIATAYEPPGKLEPSLPFGPGI
jgi:hypothetical protein